MSVQSVSNLDNFFTISRKIAKGFLQSVVVIDDQATFDEIKPTQEQADELVIPVTSGGRPGTQFEPNTVSETNTEQDLYVKQLNDCFADNGLVCGVLKPTQHDMSTISTKANHVARRADIVVFDWILRKEEPGGETALKSIVAILEGDENKMIEGIPQSRMRLIAIYTSEPDLSSIVKKVVDFLKGEGITFKRKRGDDFTLCKQGASIVFYRKDRGSKTKEKERSRTVTEDKLVNCLIDDFTKMTYGLLSNTALYSLGALRDNTHRILRKFENRLDASYLTHYTLALEDEAKEHPIPLLTSEFNDILKDCEVDKNASLDTVTKWIEHKINAKDIIKDSEINDITNEEFKTVLLDIIKNGKNAKQESYSIIEKNDNKIKSWRNKQLKILRKKDTNSKITGLLINDQSAEVRDLDFAILTTMRSQYNEPKPVLSLGSVVAQTSKRKTSYYVCIQPPCDSVRLTENTVFPFLKLYQMDLSDEKYGFDIVFFDKDKYHKLKISLKPRDICLFTLKVDSFNEIRATVDSKKAYIFETFKIKQNLRWVATLKFAHAQRIANDFARETSRVGLTESEWLRKMSS